MSFNYIGSKKSLLEFIDIPIKKILNTYNDNKILFLDGFAGTGIISTYFQSKYDNIYIISNDMEYYSYIINYSLLCVSYSNNLKNIINNINNEIKDDIKTPEQYHLISDNYSPKKSIRMFWTEKNANIADYIRYKIDTLIQDKKINKNEHIFLIASLLLSMDKFANTTSVYGAFLKNFKKSSLQPLILFPIHTNKINKIHKVYNNDINSSIILEQKYDIVYLDPPYNQRQYCSNYHPLNYISKYDKTIEIYGKTGLIKDSKKSNFCKKNEAYPTFEHLILNLNTKHILLSYNNEGLISFDKIKNLLSKLGILTIYITDYKKFKSNIKQNNSNVKEYIFHLEKSNDIHSFEEIYI